MELHEQTFEDMLSSIGEKTPTPGGGAVASLTASIGAALALMVVSYSTGRRALAEHDDLHQEAHRTLLELEQSALAMAREDAEAYGRLNELWKLDEGDERRRREFPGAVRAAIDVPERVLDASVELLELVQRLCGRTNALLRSDLAIAAVLAEAAARAAAWNVRINLPLIDQAIERKEVAQRMESRLELAGAIRRTVEEACLGTG